MQYQLYFGYTLSFNIAFNDTQIYLGFLFNIYTKIINEDETLENITTIERSIRKLEYI